MNDERRPHYGVAQPDRRERTALTWDPFAFDWRKYGRVVRLAEYYQQHRCFGIEASIDMALAIVDAEEQEGRA